MRLRSVSAWTMLVMAALSTSAGAQTPADEFVRQLDTFPGLEPKAAELIRKTWADCDDCDGEEFLTQGLTVLSPTFREGLDAYDSDRYDQAASIMGQLGGEANGFLAVNAGAYQVKSLVQQERLLEALVRVEALLSRSDDLARLSYFDAEIHFLHGYCLAALA